jgi:hypothetical protein
MNLQTYIATFISFLNGIVIPFMLGMAFLVFVINVFRFFILGGANPDSQEKAKQLAVYGVGAFVFIIIFWGVVGLLTSSFGLQLLGERESRCSDYQCPDGNNPGGSIGTQPGQPFVGGVDPRSPDVGGGLSFPSTPGATIGDAPTTPNTPSQPSQPSAPVVNTDAFPELTADVTESDNGDVAIISRMGGSAENFISYLPAIYDFQAQPIIAESVAALNNPLASNEERAIAAIRLENTNRITDNDLTRYIGVLNVDQTAMQAPQIDIAKLRPQANRPTEGLTTLVTETYVTMTNNIALNDASFWTSEARELAYAQEQVARIQQTQNDIQKMATFDMIMSDKARMSPAQITEMRANLISTINVERFFQGLPPLLETN